MHVLPQLPPLRDHGERPIEATQGRVSGIRDTLLSLRAPIALIAAFNSVLILWLIVKPGGHDLLVTVDNVAQFVGPLAALPLCFSLRRGARGHDGAGGTRAWAPVFLGLGVLSFAIGQIIWAYYELIIHQATPFPSLADIAYMLEYPLLMVGVLLLPSRQLSIKARARLALDGLMVMSAVVTFSWYFILGPTVIQGGETVLARLVGTAYPVWDLLLVACVLVLAAGARDRVSRQVVLVLGAGLGMSIIADYVFDYTTLHGTYATGLITDAGWTLGTMLISLAAYIVRRENVQRLDDPVPVPAGAVAKTEKDRSTWTSFLPYAFVPAVAILLIYAVRSAADAELRTGVEIGSGVLFGLVLLRQILAIEENRSLSRRLQGKNDELARANTRLQALATTDPHTDLPNHRAVVDALDRELERAHRYNRPCALLFVDLDHFKAVNDRLGHQAGDSALNELAGVMIGTLRGIDFVGRWGGEEFVAILPETPLEAAGEIADRLRAAVATHSFCGGIARLTCSIGVAAYPGDGTNRDALIHGADQAMYAAKRLGRNQVRLSGDPALDVLGSDDWVQGTADQASLARTVEALASLVDSRDLTTGPHAHDVSNLSACLALEVGLEPSDAQLIGLAGRLRDIGKIAVPDAILRKPGRLTEDEWKFIRTHPIVGAGVVERLRGLDAVAPIVRAHHEWWNGLGYPEGLAREAIPLGARIVAIADTFAALTSQRTYRESMSDLDAMGVIRRGAGLQFDPQLVRAFERLLEANRLTARNREAS